MNEVENGKCLLGKNPMQDQGCSEIQCETCGWNPKVRDQRNILRKDGNMKVCEDGLTRLVLARVEEAAGQVPNNSSKVMSTNERECEFCGKIFTRHRIDQRCCSTTCRRKLGAFKSNQKRKQQQETI